MIGFAALALALTLATLALLTRPLWRQARPDDVDGDADAKQREAIDALRRRMVELDAAHSAGSVSDADHSQAREALEKRIVAAVVGSPALPATATGEAKRRPMALILGLAGSVCAVAALGYLVDRKSVV